MERLNYSEVVQTVLKNHVKNRSNSQTEVQLIFDTERDRYQVINIGWQARSLALVGWVELLRNPTIDSICA